MRRKTHQINKWLPVDRHTLRSKAHRDIFGLGDSTDLPVSKSGAAAHFQAKVVTANVIADVRGESTTAGYDEQVMCYFDGGYHRAMAMGFDYEHPPKAREPSVVDWLGKRFLNRTYWALVATGRV